MPGGVGKVCRTDFAGQNLSYRPRENKYKGEKG